MEIIFDQVLFEKALSEIKSRSLSINESQLNSPFNRYPRHAFEPLHDYLNESFLKGIVAKGKSFADKFVKGAKEISLKIANAVKGFSFKKIFATVTKMMQKIKAKVLKSLMILLSPLREVIISNGFASENNKFSAKACFNKLVSVSKEVGKDMGAQELLSDAVVGSMSKNVNLEGTSALAEGEDFSEGTATLYEFINKQKTEEEKTGVATFDKKDIKYLDFFQKILLKLGVKNAKINGFFAEIAKKITQGAAITGIFTLIGAILPSMGIISAIAGAAGAAVAAAPVLVMIIGAILFGIGLFMFATWLLKPYPTVKDCEIFLASIFDGANLFDFPENDLGDIAKNTVTIKKLRKIKVKPAFNTEVIIELEKEGVDDETSLDEESNEVVKLYDDLDIDTLEDQQAVTDNISLVRKFVRNIFTEKGREKLATAIEDDIDENESDYAELLQDLLDIVEKCSKINAEELDKNGKKKFPFAINSQKMQQFLTDKNNTAKDRLSKIIDSVDNFVDRVDKSTTK